MPDTKLVEIANNVDPDEVAHNDKNEGSTLSASTLLILNMISGNMLEGDVGDIVSLPAQTSPYFQLRKKFNCIENTDRSKTQLKTSP